MSEIGIHVSEVSAIKEDNDGRYFTLCETVQSKRNRFVELNVSELLRAHKNTYIESIELIWNGKKQDNWINYSGLIQKQQASCQNSH